MPPSPSVPATALPAAMSHSLIIVLMAMLLGLQAVATDLYLPTLPALREEFAAPMSQVQLTLTGMLLAFGVSQLVWGPLSDRFGRRPVLMGGLLAFVVASVGCTLAPSMEVLVVWRIVQGAAMGAGVMCSRAIVRDLYKPVEGARVMSKGLTGLGIIGCASAPVGGLLADWFGWRTALMAVAVFGGVALAMIVLRFQETNPHRNPGALRPRALLRAWGGIARHPVFLSFSALAVASYSGLFTFLATSSFVFIQVMSLSRTQYGLLMFSMSLAYISGTFLCRWLVMRVGVRRAVSIAGFISLLGGTLLGVLSLAGRGQAWYGPACIMGPVYLYVIGHGVHQPCSQSGVVGPFPQSAGTASALNGFLMMISAFAMGSWLGTHMDGTPLPLTLGVWFWSALVALSAWTLVRRHGATPAH